MKDLLQEDISGKEFKKFMEDESERALNAQEKFENMPNEKDFQEDRTEYELISNNIDRIYDNINKYFD